MKDKIEKILREQIQCGIFEMPGIPSAAERLEKLICEADLMDKDAENFKDWHFGGCEYSMHEETEHITIKLWNPRKDLAFQDSVKFVAFIREAVGNYARLRAENEAQALQINFLSSSDDFIALAQTWANTVVVKNLLESENASLQSSLSASDKRIEELEGENEKMRKSLEYYADENKWAMREGFGNAYKILKTREDGFVKAQEALESLEKK